MGRSRRRSSRKVSPWLIALALVFYVGAVGALSTESLAFRLLLTLGCIGAVVAIIGGFFAAADSPIAKVSRVARSRMGMVLTALGLTSLGLAVGWSEAKKRSDQAAAVARAAAEQEAAEAKFRAMSSAGHLDAARTAMAEGFDAATRTGGQLSLAERHLRAIPGAASEAPLANVLLLECVSRPARALILAAEHEVESGTGEDIFRRLDLAREMLRKIPASVPEHAIGEALIRTWRQREASEHLAAAQKEVDLATDDTIFQRLEVADDHLQKIPTDTPERPLADSLQKKWQRRAALLRLSAARSAIKERAYVLAAAHLAHVPPNSPFSATAIALSKKADSLRKADERRQAQSSADSDYVDAGSVGGGSGGRQRGSGGSVYVHSYTRRDGTYVRSHTRSGGRRR